MHDRATHEANAPLRGDPARALDAAAVALTTAGFQLVGRTASSIDLTAVSAIRTAQNPLAGASSIALKAAGNRLSLTAQLGGVARVARLLRVLPTISMVVVALSLTWVFLFVLETKSTAIWSVLVAVVVSDLFFVLVLAPAVARRLETRTRAALDTLVTNASALAAKG